MVFSINKQAIEIKSRFHGITLTSVNECCCAIGILAKMYGLPLPQKHESLVEMKEELYRGIDGKSAPSEYASKIIDMLDGYNGMEPLQVSYMNYCNMLIMSSVDLNRHISKK